ncbi:MAG: hypothetical protein KAJ12_05045 [Bacteroidetes bacterium]|nr:hypothetical protein [Bacteroidota bacterium]
MVVQNSCALLLAVLVPFLSLSCSGEKPQEEEAAARSVLLPAGEVHEGWYFAAGDRVTIEGTVNGDAYIAGGEVNVYGTINGDLLIAGGQVTVSGSVSDDIRAAGGTLRFTGKTGKNIAAAGGTLTFERSAEIAGNLLAFGGGVQLAGTVGGEAKISAGEMSMTGAVNGDVEFAGGKFTSHTGAMIAGDLNVLVSETEDVEIAEGTVQGQVEITTQEPRRAARILGFPEWGFWMKVVWALSLLATVLFLVFVFPKQLVESGITILSHPGRSALWGILGLLLVPFVVLLLLGTIIGVPLGLFLFVMYLWLLYLTQISAGVVVSHWLMGVNGKEGWALYGAVVIGVLAVQVLTFIPYVHILVILVGVIFGFGGLLLVTYNEMRAHRSSPQSQ